MVHLAKAARCCPSILGLRILWRTAGRRARPAQATLEDIERQAIAAALVRLAEHRSDGLASASAALRLYRKDEQVRSGRINAGETLGEGNFSEEGGAPASLPKPIGAEPILISKTFMLIESCLQHLRERRTREWNIFPNIPYEPGNPSFRAPPRGLALQDNQRAWESVVPVYPRTVLSDSHRNELLRAASCS